MEKISCSKIWQNKNKLCTVSVCKPVHEIFQIVYERQINEIRLHKIALILKSKAMKMVAYSLLDFIMIKNTFDPEKAIEAILYIASKIPIPDLRFICKILYFADKLHLEKFGRLITGDSYIALDNGPAPSTTLDLLNSLMLGINTEITDSARTVFDIDGCGEIALVKTKRNVVFDLFSSSDLYCIDDAISTYGHMDFEAVSNTSKDKNWHSADQSGDIQIETMALNCKDGELLLQYLINTSRCE